MTSIQKRKLLEKIVNVENDISTLKKVRMELCSSGYASATMSSGGGSKSYTRLDISKVTETIAQLTSELKSLRALLQGGSRTLPGQIVTIYM